MQEESLGTEKAVVFEGFNTFFRQLKEENGSIKTEIEKEFIQSHVNETICCTSQRMVIT